MILRKGAVSAQKDERLIIPLNMWDGALLCVGKGNEDWNCAAPHGAGRCLSRAEARQSFTLSQYKKGMKKVFTTSVSRDTLDECPMAYEPPEEILAQIGPGPLLRSKTMASRRPSAGRDNSIFFLCPLEGSGSKSLLCRSFIRKILAFHVPAKKSSDCLSQLILSFAGSVVLTVLHKEDQTQHVAL